MNDGLRKKLTEQQQRISRIAEERLKVIEKEAAAAYEMRDEKMIKLFEMYRWGIKGMEFAIISEIEEEKLKKGR